MFTFQELHERLQKMAGYTSASDIQWGKDTINETQKYVSALQNWDWTDKVLTTTSTASQLTVKLPVDYRKLSKITIINSGTRYTPMEMPDPVKFDQMRGTNPDSTSDYPSYFHIRAGQVLLYPALSSAGNTIEIEYQSRPVDMTADDHTTGNITDVTNGDTTVEGGSSPAWTQSMVGMYLQITSDGQWYKVASVTDSDTLELDIPFEGVTISGGTEAYRIAPLPVIPEDFQEILWMRPLSQWYMLKSDESRVDKYLAWSNDLIDQMKKKYAYNSHINISKSAGGGSAVFNPNYNSRTITIT